MSEKRQITVSVRRLVEFICRRGDLVGKNDFTGANRAWEGIAGHQLVQKSRPEGYRAEVTVRCSLDTPDFILTIQGRIDGVWQGPEGVVVEEIKTVVGHWDGSDDPLHWAQGRIYGALLARQEGLAKVDVQLGYLQLETRAWSQFRRSYSLAELETYFREVTAEYLDWVDQEVKWSRQRDLSIQRLAFPFSTYRPGQRNLCVTVYRALARQGRLYVEAPTGVGKTVSVLFPAIKALGQGTFSRIFYLTAKTLGRTVAEKSLQDMRGGGLRLRSVTLTAKEKICLSPTGQACDARTCPMALGYFDRIKPALRESLESEHLGRAELEELARRHQVCPFELSLDASFWADAIICDYNYLFDPKVYLRRFFAEGGDYAFLIDEAHNLADRARSMFSARLEKSAILDLRKTLEEPLPRCARALGKISRYLAGLDRQSLSEEGEKGFEGERSIPRLPDDLVPMLKGFNEEAETWLVQNQAADFREPLRELYFQVADFLRIAQLYDERFATLLKASGRRFSIDLFCLDPSRMIRQALERGKASVFFSATLSPLEFFRDVLGGEAGDEMKRFDSPFAAEHLGLLVADRISTYYRARESTYHQVMQAIHHFASGKTGNYLVYFPSYRYLEEVRGRFESAYPGMMTVVQSPVMKEEAREEFLSRFQAGLEQSLVGFAVMGGLFGEGIDLVGDRLSGVVVVGVGLPQLCLERNLIREFFQEAKGSGFEYAYLYPGMNRVVQAAGRVIRSETDRGLVLLIDTRFREERYRRLFPPWWRPLTVSTPEEIASSARDFWLKNLPIVQS